MTTEGLVPRYTVLPSHHLRDNICFPAYLALFFSFVLGVLPHLFSSYEEVLLDTPTLSLKELDSAIVALEYEVQRQPEGDAIRYFEILNNLIAIERQCHLRERQTRGTPVVVTEMYWACQKVTVRTSLGLYDKLYNAYIPHVRDGTIYEARDRYSGLHPHWEDRQELTYEHIWHWNELVSAYVNSCVIATLFFLTCMAHRGFKGYLMILEVFTPRYWLAVLFWPIGVCVYPGQPFEQIRKIARAFAYVVSFSVSLFSGVGVQAAGTAGSKKGNRTEDSTFNISGFAQAVVDGKGPHQFRTGNIRLTVKGSMNDRWNMLAEFGVSPFDWEQQRVVRQLFVEYRDTDVGAVRLGRFFPAAQWNTPYPSKLETVLYPLADPTRGEATGVMWSATRMDVTTHVAITGISGQPFASAANFEGYELGARIEWPITDLFTGAVTFQHRPDVTWGSGLVSYQSQDERWHVRGVVYGGSFVERSFVSAYMLGSYRLNGFVEVHGMFDHGLDTQDRITGGITFYPFDRKSVSITLDGRYSTETRRLEPMLRLQVAF